MFNLFKKKIPKETGVIGSPVSGKIIKIEEVKDDIFSTKMMGDGFAVIPDDSKFVSPCDGKISMIFPTGHAYGITSVDGVEILVHIGKDTVEENGNGFKVVKKTGDSVFRGDVVIEADIEYLKSKYDLVTPCIVTNLDEIKNMEIKHYNEEIIIKYNK